jgi:hypothetical protein
MRIRLTYIVVFFLLFGLAGDVLTIDPESGFKNKICDLSCSSREVGGGAESEEKKQEPPSKPKDKPMSEGIVCLADSSGGLNCYLKLEAGATRFVADPKRPRRAPR